MNPSKRERWPIPRTTRHVWILRKYRFEVPWQGFVLDWVEVRKGRWKAQVLYVDERAEGRPRIIRWLPAAQLLPVRSVPED